jgi:hypothetical protein
VQVVGGLEAAPRALHGQRAVLVELRAGGWVGGWVGW